ncbi:MAG: DNA mismatch repair protein MutS [Deltaproteobacteria bacterium]|nr:MAG: DNA mismatch repair protein MutS [Deltaproteobacteria bacterium]
MEPVILDITDVLDLHTFQPRDVPDLIDDYLTACVEKGLHSVRIIHGKGTGIMKARVRRILARHARVESFTDAPLASGGWGATLVQLYPEAASTG